MSFLDVFCSVEQFLDLQPENVENKDGRAICEPIWGIYRIESDVRVHFTISCEFFVSYPIR